MDIKLKRVWAMINKVAPAMKLSPSEYKYQLGYSVLGRVDGSIKDMSSVGFSEVIRRINSDASSVGINLTPNPSPAERGAERTVVSVPARKYGHGVDLEKEACNRMRRKVIGMAYEMRWAPTSDWQTAMKKIDEFCIGRHGKYGKPLNKHTYNELIQVVSQFELLVKKFYIEVAKHGKV